MPKTRIIVDTDAGHDDALALMLLIKSGLFDVAAVTAVAGNSTLNNVTRNAQAVLDLLGASGVPLHSGADAPLKRQLVTAVVHGDSGLDGLDMSRTKYQLDGEAVDCIIKEAHNHPDKMTVLALGPLTNIAAALQKAPEIAKKIEKVVVMGGAIDVAGNKNRTAEFNFFVDPEAADIVFRSGLNLVVVPLDPCNDILLSINTFEELKGSTLYEPLTNMMRHFITGIEKEEGVKGALVYDALAAYYLIRPDAFTLEGMDIVIETKGEYTAGMSVAEKRLGKEKQVNAQVVRHIDADAFTADLLAALRT